MAYKLAVLIALVAAAAAAPTVVEESPVGGIPGFNRVFSNAGHNGGPYHDFFTYETDLSKVMWDKTTTSMDNSIMSYCVTGIWMFYNDINYNAGEEDYMFWTHGIDFCDDVPDSQQAIATSFRYSGSTEELDDDSFTLFQETGFQGVELYSTASMADLKTMSAKAESIIISGKSSWTFYTEANYGGTKVCAGFDTTDTSGDQTLHVAMITTLAETWNNSIKSVKKGCETTTRMAYEPLVATRQSANGASGSFVVKRH